MHARDDAGEGIVAIHLMAELIDGEPCRVEILADDLFNRGAMSCSAKHDDPVTVFQGCARATVPTGVDTARNGAR